MNVERRLSDMECTEGKIKRLGRILFKYETRTVKETAEVYLATPQYSKP